MVRKGVSIREVREIIAHPKSFGACRRRVAATSLPTLHVRTNGEAARLVAESTEHAFSAALGPKSASIKYNLEVPNEAFEDVKAVTTFFLIAPKSHRVQIGKENRMLIVFSIPHRSGALVKVLRLFERERVSLEHIHSVYAGNRTYRFALELECSHRKLPALKRVQKELANRVDQYLSFGPFEILSK